jgi:hypothetical protein
MLVPRAKVRSSRRVQRKSMNPAITEIVALVLIRVRLPKKGEFGGLAWRILSGRTQLHKEEHSECDASRLNERLARPG